MNRFAARLRKIPPFVRALTVGAGFATVVALAMPVPERGPAEGPPAPPVVTIPQPESRPVAGPLTLTALSIGPEPRVLAPGRRVVSTFLTNDSETCRVMATARLTSGKPGLIRWTIAAPAGFIVPADGKWTGPRLDVMLRRPGGNPTGLGGPLAVTVQARIQVEGEQYTARETVVQDEVDQLRQEYVDLLRRQVPERTEFLNAQTFAARYGSRFPWLRFEDVNWSVNPTTGQRYSYAIVRPELVRGLDRVRQAYGGVTINSGYRNPVRQVEVHAPVRESLHQYGFAADLAVRPGEGRALPNEVDWRGLAEIACHARATWVEPLASSSPNSPGCHLHLDYRPGPISSAPVRLTGRVVDTTTGRPIPGAVVVLGAMPARTDGNGFFSIRNVLSGGEYPVEVSAEGFETLVQPVRLVAWGTASTCLAMGAEGRPKIGVEVARTRWLDQRLRLLALTLRVTNAGTSEVGDLQTGVYTPVAVVSKSPVGIASLPAGGARGTETVLRLQETAPVPLAVRLTFRSASGAAETVRFDLTALPPGVVPVKSAAPPTSLSIKAEPKPSPGAPTVTSPLRPSEPEQPALKNPAPVTSPAAPATSPAAPAGEPQPKGTEPQPTPSPPDGETPPQAPPVPAPGTEPPPPSEEPAPVEPSDPAPAKPEAG